MPGYRFLKFLTLYCCELVSYSATEKQSRTQNAAAMLASAFASVTGKEAHNATLASSGR